MNDIYAYHPGAGTYDSWPELQSNLSDIVASGGGCLKLPSGRYILSQPLTIGIGCSVPISITGAGQNVTTLVVRNPTAALTFRFAQDGQDQPYGLNLSDIGILVEGDCACGIDISYGNPLATSDHFAPSTTLRNVVVQTRNTGTLQTGIRIEAAWNVSMTNVCVSGNPRGGNWNAMTGCGIKYERMCVNAKHVSVECNFWATGFYYNAGDGGNTEGLFFTGCVFVGVQRGVWIIGNSRIANAPRVSTFVWQGGMIECRVAGVEGGSAAFHLVHVWTALISGCQMLAECLPTTHTTYGVFLDTCAGVVVSGCDVNAWHVGLNTTGQCNAINSRGNTYTNCELQNVFNNGTIRSRTGEHVCFNDEQNDFDYNGYNLLGS